MTVTVRVDRGPEDHEVVWLDNGILALGAVPAAGGRLLSVRLRGRETLWRDAELLDDDLRPRGDHRISPHGGAMHAWVNYGGDKTWPAPQGWDGPAQWAGPPDPVLDSGAYAWEVDEGADGAATLRMTSSPDPRTGLRLERALTLEPDCSSYEVRLRAINTVDHPVRWSLWNVTQRPAGAPDQGGVWVGGEPGAAGPVGLVTGTALPASRQLPDGRVHIPHQDVVGKLGFPGATGWIAHVADGTSTALGFAVDETAVYPDEGSRAEVWLEHPLPAPLAHLGDLRPRHRIVEIEVLGPIVELAPGEASALTFRCGLSSGQGAVSAVAPAAHWGEPQCEGSAAHIEIHPHRSGELRLDGVPGIPLRAGLATTLELPLPFPGGDAVIGVPEHRPVDGMLARFPP